jgi:hypothetical protein
MAPRRSLVTSVLALVSLAGLLGGQPAKAEEQASPKQIEFFEKKIRPVLVAECYKCHSSQAEKLKAGLRLDTKEGMLAGGESGPAIVPGDAAGSLLLQAIRHESFEMPPDKQLSDEVIADFEKWIADGAADPRTGGTAVAKRTIDIEEGRKFWAFQPPKKTSPPPVKDAAWPRTEIDQFLLAAMESQGLAPVGDADRRVLIRRLYFDLIGLPPTPEQVEAFLSDKSDKAVETVVDILLASPQFGERWGRHWLDVARFAESNGNADNLAFPHAWRYRDYVIASLNADKPFDRFVTEQLAGDLLESSSPQERDELLIATGFLALGSKPRAQNNPDFQMDVVAEQLEVATSGLMGLTVACARCHDHKFDPIPTSEYYALAGIFTSTQTLYGTGARGNANNNRVGGGFHTLAGDGTSAAKQEEHAKQLAAAREEQTKLIADLKEMAAELPAALTAPPRRNPNNNRNVPKPDDLVSQIKPPDDASDETKEQVAQMAARMGEALKQIQSLEANPPPQDVAMGARDDRNPADCAICIRGASQDRGEVVPRGFVSVATVGEAPAIAKGKSGRLELAQWIASPQNPLTSRVIVNRIWQHLFGRGIVPTVDNFGALGEKPSHPELLDHLAVKFVEDGWSIKRMVRTLVLTRAYALASDHDAAQHEKDPNNVFVWKHPQRRLDAESIRDAILFVSGSLKAEAMPGSALPLANPQGVINIRVNVDQLPAGKETYRSVYLPIVRNNLPEVLELFDAADPSLVIGQRDVTTVPAQSLYLMNSPFVIGESKLLAQRVLEREGADEQRIARAFELSLSRAPTAEEQSRSLSFLTTARREFGEHQNQAAAELKSWSALSQALLASAEFRYID